MFQQDNKDGLELVSKRAARLLVVPIMSDHPQSPVQSLARPPTRIGWLIGAWFAGLLILMAVLGMAVRFGIASGPSQTPDPESTGTSVRLSFFIGRTIEWIPPVLIVIWTTAAFCLYRLAAFRMPIVAMTIFAWLTVALTSALPLATWHLVESSPLIYSSTSRTYFTRGDLNRTLEPALMLFVGAVSPFVVGFVGRLVERLLRRMFGAKAVAPLTGA